MNSLLYYDFSKWTYIILKNGRKTKRYIHWCSKCGKNRGYAYKNKILKAPFCHSCKMASESTRFKIGQKSKDRLHSNDVKQKISDSLYKRYGTNPLLTKIKRNLRSRLNKAIHGDYKKGSAVDDLGCSIQVFKIYIESFFVQGMTWDNYGEWHIDHIIPLCSFNLNDMIELKKACHFSNLQPMWAKDNLQKRHIDGTFK